jgi:transcriptional regulator with XRE-family HTH domain
VTAILEWTHIILLGQVIKQARQERNLTQEQLGELVGVQKLKSH